MASIKEYWIEELREVKEFQLLSEIEDAEIAEVKTAISELIDNQFIQTAKEKGIARREQILKIKPFADDSLEDRRFRILSRWNDKLPYTYRVLIGRLNQMCGENGYTIEINSEAYTLKIRIELTQKRMFDEAKLMTRRVCPANILLDIELRYNQHKDFVNLTHTQLGSYTHEQLRNEVIV